MVVSIAQYDSQFPSVKWEIEDIPNMDDSDLLEAFHDKKTSPKMRGLILEEWEARDPNHRINLG